MRQVMFILHPHEQSSLSATRFTAGLSRSSSDCAKSGPPRSATEENAGLCNLRMFFCHSKYLCARIRQPILLGIRHTIVPMASTQKPIQIQDTSGKM